MYTPEIDPEEMAALSNARFFELKNSLDFKVKELFSLLKKNLEALTSTGPVELPASLKQSNGRRFQGENYQGFPWRAFDYPRASAKPDLFLFRCLLLWGHGFSFHLILTGTWQQQLSSSLLSAQDQLAQSGFQLDTRLSAWDWIPDPEQLLPLENLPANRLQAHLQKHPHCKISLFHPLSEFSEIPAHGAKHWSLLQELLFKEA